jgi:branched-chain amino acid transport system ATP-binding protein
MSEPLLQVQDVVVRFGGLTALDGVDLAVEEGTTAGLIGPNGAGKTTLFNVITGFLRPASGTARFAGQPLTGRPPHVISRMGLIRTFQRARPLPELTVLENAMAGVFRQGKTGALHAALGLRSARREEAAAREHAMELLESVGLARLHDALPSELTAGQLRLLEITRALAAGPRMVLLDEPAAGLTRQETEALAQTIMLLPEVGITCLLVEHDVELVFKVCNTISVLDFGKMIARGTPADIRQNPAVIRSYLGQRDESQTREAAGG